MSKWLRMYKRTGLYDVYNFSDTGGKARSSLLFATMVQAATNGLSGGVFYTGLLLSYGINIVNISILTFIPYIASIFSLLTPYILGRFKKRRRVLAIARFVYYIVNILGITLLPQLVVDESARIVGLVTITFLHSIINFTFFPGYLPWHMHYITPDIRIPYISSTNIVSNICSTGVMIFTSLFTDRLQGADQQNLIIVLRYVALALSMVDIYFMSAPKEPEYLESTKKVSITDIFRIPLSNARFMWTLLVQVIYTFVVNIVNGVYTTWVLNDVQCGYLYFNILGSLGGISLILTGGFWNRKMQKMGTFRMFVLSALAFAPTYILQGFINSQNFMVVMTTVYVLQNLLVPSRTYSASNLIYINLPKEDQTCYTSFYSIINNIAAFVSLFTGTMIVSVMGDTTITLFGQTLGSIPLILIGMGLLHFVMALFVWIIRGKVETDAKI